MLMKTISLTNILDEYYWYLYVTICLIPSFNEHYLLDLSWICFLYTLHNSYAPLGDSTASIFKPLLAFAWFPIIAFVCEVGIHVCVCLSPRLLKLVA